MYNFHQLIYICLTVNSVTMIQSNRNISKHSERLESHRGELKDVCRSTNDCRTHAYVCGATQQCECARGYRPDHGNSTCLGAIGQTCMYDNHCISNAYCKGQTICTCKLEFVESDDKWSCLGDWESTGTTVQPTGRVMKAIIFGFLWTAWL